MRMLSRFVIDFVKFNDLNENDFVMQSIKSIIDNDCFSVMLFDFNISQRLFYVIETFVLYIVILS